MMEPMDSELPNEFQVLEAMGITSSYSTEERGSFAGSSSLGPMVLAEDSDVTPESGRGASRCIPAPQLVCPVVIEDEDSLIAEEAWQEVPDYVIFDEPAEQCEDTESPDHADVDESDVPDTVRARKRGGRRHKGHFMKRPMAMSEVIEELQHPELRENALRCLSGHLIERREHDSEFYRQAGYYLYYSCSTVAVLLQEVTAVYERLNAKDLKVRGSKRLSNVLTLLQSIAANDETRWEFVKAGIPNYLLPFILANYSEEVYENIRSISLSVIAVVCQARDTRIIGWAIDSDIIEACLFALEIGSELSKVLALAILESLFRKTEGVLSFCESDSNLLPRLLKICGDLVNILAEVQGFSPRLLFLILRVFILLCQSRRALELLREHLPEEFEDSTFNDLRRDYPIFNHLLHQLHLFTGRASHSLPSTQSLDQPLTSEAYLSSTNTWGMEVSHSTTLL